MSKAAVVIGAGQGGLSAAIELRLAGFDVTVLEAREVVGGKAAQLHESGFRLDPGPSIVIMPEIYQDVFRRTGRNPDDYLQFQRLDPITRVYTEGPDFIDLPADRDEALKVVAAISSKDAASMGRLFETLDKNWEKVRRTVFSKPFEHWWQLLNPDLIGFGMAFDVRKPYRQLIDDWFESPLMRAFFYGFPSYSGQTYNKPCPGALTIPYLMLTQGVWWPLGGIGAIPKAFERLARELGVEIRTGCRVSKFLSSGGATLAGVQLESGEVVNADVIISNLDRLTTEQMLQRPITAKPSFSYFTIHWGLEKPFDGLAHHTLLIPDGFEKGFDQLYNHREYPEPPIVYLNETALTDAETAPEGKSNLFAVLTVPAEETHLNWQNPAKYIESTKRVMSKFGFDLEAEPIFTRVQTPTTFRERDGNYRGSLYGVDESERVLGGMFPLKNRDVCPNLFYCGGSVQPGAGLAMVTLSGQFAAAMAAKRL